MSVKLVDSNVGDDTALVAVTAIITDMKEPVEMNWVWTNKFPLVQAAKDKLRAECIDSMYELALHNEPGKKIGYYVEFTEEINNDCTN